MTAISPNSRPAASSKRPLLGESGVLDDGDACDFALEDVEDVFSELAFLADDLGFFEGADLEVAA